MGIKRGTPGRGGKPRVDQFSYTGVERGLKNAWNGWLAGEPYWAEEAHEHRDEDPGTKPCLHWLTDGALKCPRCRKGREVKCIGWVPVYRESDSLPRIVIVHESASDLLHGLHYPDYVLIGRVDAVSSVFVKRSDSRVSLVTEKECRKRAVDIVPDLLTMWGYPELNEWLKYPTRPAADAPDVPPVLKQRLSVPPPTTEVEAQAIDAEKKQKKYDLRAAVEQIGKHPPSANGKHE